MLILVGDGRVLKQGRRCSPVGAGTLHKCGRLYLPAASSSVCDTLRSWSPSIRTPATGRTHTMIERRQSEQRATAAARRTAFTLVELLVAVAIIGTLASLLLAGVQVSREMARKTSCSNNLRNQILAVHEFVAAQQRFPAGREYSPIREYSWCVEVLPQLEQTALYQRYDRTKSWNDPA